MHRIFIVGYPRSGTTLLQSLLGAHKALATFTESELFVRALRPWRYYRPFHLRRGPIVSRATEFLRNNRSEDLVQSEALQRLKRSGQQKVGKGAGHC
jgi:hypothetical protein